MKRPTMLQLRAALLAPGDPRTRSEATKLWIESLPDDLAGQSVATMSRADLARYQHHMAHVGQAEGQCPTCRAYRADGHAPQLHVPGMPCCDQDGRPC